MFGGWKATCYLRVGEPLLHFVPLKPFFANAFHTGSPEHKAKAQDGSRRHHWPLCCVLFWLASVSSLTEGQSGGLEEAQADWG